MTITFINKTTITPEHWIVEELIQIMENDKRKKPFQKVVNKDGKMVLLINVIEILYIR